MASEPSTQRSVLILAPFLSRRYSGTAHAALSVVTALAAQRDLSVRVASFAIDEGAVPDHVPQTTLPSLPRRRGTWRVNRAFALGDHRRVLEGVARQPVDVMYTPSMDMALAYSALQPGVRIVTHLGHIIGAREAMSDSPLAEPWRTIDARLMDRIERRCYELPDAVHIVSTRLVAEQRAAHFGLPHDFFRIRPLGIDIERFSDRSMRTEMRAQLGAAPHDCVIVTVSRLVAWKNTDWVLRAMATLPRHCRLVVVGDGPLRASLEGAVPSDAAGRVHFTGHTDPRPWLAAADVFALPSAIESFGVAYAEAMCMGLPCIGLRNDPPESLSSAQDVLGHGESGFVVSDEGELVDRLLQLAIDPAMRDTMGAHARQRAMAEYSQERYAEYLGELFPPRITSAAGG